MGGEALKFGRISKGFACSSDSKDDPVGVFSADLRLDGLESSTGERGRVVFRAVGAVFLVPFKIASCDLPGVVLIMDGIGGASVAGLFIVEYLLLEEFGTLKFGVAGEWVRTDRAGPPYVEWRYVLGAWWASRIGTYIACIDLRRSLIAAAFGLGRTSSVEIFGGKSSKLGVVSRVGEVAGDEPLDVMSVR
jgi:hypothetical protein